MKIKYPISYSVLVGSFHIWVEDSEKTAHSTLR